MAGESTSRAASAGCSSQMAGGSMARSQMAGGSMARSQCRLQQPDGKWVNGTQPVQVAAARWQVGQWHAASAGCSSQMAGGSMSQAASAGCSSQMAGESMSRAASAGCICSMNALMSVVVQYNNCPYTVCTYMHSVSLYTQCVLICIVCTYIQCVSLYTQCVLIYIVCTYIHSVYLYT